MTDLRAIAGLAAAGFLLAAEASASATDGTGVAVIAHRGWHRAPGVNGAENSVAALKAAQDAGFWGSEFDVHLTADEVVVVRHDDTINGTNVWEQSYADIAGTKLPNGERIPTLDEYLEQGEKCRTTMLVVEIKKEGAAATAASAPAACRLADLCIEALRRHRLLSPSRVMFISFSDAACRHVAAALPGFRVECITTKTPEAAAALGATGIDFSQSVYTAAATSNYVERARALGLSVGGWTIDSTNQIRTAVSLGLDAITSNNPDAVRALLGAAERTVPPPPADIPPDWLERNAAFAIEAAGGDYERAAFETAANGTDTVWQCYVSGVCPTNAEERFVAHIRMEDGTPVVTWTPDLGEARVYSVEGRATLEDSWGETNASSRFFRVKVRMPAE